MQIIRINVTLVILIILTGCGGSGGSNGNNGTTSPDTVISEDSFSIGPDGGTLSTDDIEITIPVGALSSTQNVTILKTLNADEDVSYVLQGLSSQLFQPIQVKLPISSARGSDDYLLKVTVEGNCYAPTLYEEVDCIDMYDGTNDGSTFTATIPANSDMDSTAYASMAVTTRAQTAATTTDWVLTLITGYQAVSSDSGYYRIFITPAAYDKELVAYIFESMAYAESYFSKMPLDQIKYPYPIYILDKTEISLIGDDAGFMLSDKNNRFLSSIIINKDVFNWAKTDNSRRIELGATAGHEFFHGLQVAYMPDHARYSQWYIYEKDPYFWLMEASSTWFERIMTTGVLNPAAESTYSSFFIYGLEADIDNASSFFQTTNKLNTTPTVGYGMGLFFNYLSSKAQTSELIFKIWDKAHSGLEPLNAMEAAVLEVLGDTLDVLWQAFITMHFSEKMEIDPEETWPHAPESYHYTTSSAGSDGFHVRFDMPKYGAVGILLENTESKTVDLAITASTGGYAEVIVLDDKGDALTSVSSQTAVSIPVGVTYKLVMISKSESDNVDLVIDKTENTLSKYTKASVSASVKGMVTRLRTSELEDETITETTQESVSFSVFTTDVTGAFSGTTFTATTGDTVITVTLDSLDNPTRYTQVEINQNQENFHQKIVLKNIPLEVVDDPAIFPKAVISANVSLEDRCTYLYSVEYEKTTVIYPGGAVKKTTYEDTYHSYDCQAEAFFFEVSISEP